MEATVMEIDQLANKMTTFIDVKYFSILYFYIFKYRINFLSVTISINSLDSLTKTKLSNTV